MGSLSGFGELLDEEVPRGRGNQRVLDFDGRLRCRARLVAFNCAQCCLDERFHETCGHGAGGHGTDGVLMDSSFVVDRTRSFIMAGWRQAVELAMSDEEIAKLAAIARARSETARRVERAQMLLSYRENPS